MTDAKSPPALSFVKWRNLPSQARYICVGTRKVFQMYTGKGACALTSAVRLDIIGCYVVRRAAREPSFAAASRKSCTPCPNRIILGAVKHASTRSRALAAAVHTGDANVKQIGFRERMYMAISWWTGRPACRLSICIIR